MNYKYVQPQQLVVPSSPIPIQNSISNNIVINNNTINNKSSTVPSPTSTSPTSSNTTNNTLTTLPPAKLEHVLDDICSRFLNSPAEDLESTERLFFLLEEAHWYYEDFYRSHYAGLPTFKLKQFAEVIFRHCILLHPYLVQIDNIFGNFQDYKFKIPVCGSIILNEAQDKILLVKGWSKSSTWGFPRGKIAKDETEVECAIREVYEEVGFDLSSKIAKDDFITLTLREQKIKLFIVSGISESTNFVTRTRNEISKIQWHSLDSLHSNPQSFYTIIPFLRELTKILRNKNRNNKVTSPTRSNSTSQPNNFSNNITTTNNNKSNPTTRSNGKNVSSKPFTPQTNKTSSVAPNSNRNVNTAPKPFTRSSQNITNNTNTFINNKNVSIARKLNYSPQAQHKTISHIEQRTTPIPTQLFTINPIQSGHNCAEVADFTQDKNSLLNFTFNADDIMTCFDEQILV